MSKLSFTLAQEQAIHQSGTNLLVAAGAGSGKTRVLTERVVLRLTEGVSITRLVVLTFTNAAADEMKQRIKEKIAKIPQLSLELRQIDTAMISTFDAFALRMVKQYHYLLGLDKEIDVVDNVILADLKQRCLKDTLDRHYALDDPLFSKVAIQLFDRGDRLLQEGVIVLADGLEMIANQQTYLDEMIHLTNDREKNQLIDAFYKLCQEHLHDIRSLVQETLEEANQIDHEKVQRFSEQITCQYDPLFSAMTLDELMVLLSKWKNPIFPRASDFLPAEELEILKARYEQTKERLNDLRTLFKTLMCDSVSEMKADLSRLTDTIQVVVAITRDYLSLLEQRKREQSLFHFTDIMHLAIRLFQNHPALLREFRTQIFEVMVDEYQDTNDLQEYLLEMIADNNLFAVGDIKQSIYGFRNANPQNFLKKYQDYCQNIHGEAISLTDNFRSRKEVIDAVNWVFSQVMDAEIGGIDYHDDQRLVASNTSYETYFNANQSATPDILLYERTDQEPLCASERLEAEALAIKNDIIHKINTKYQVYDPQLKVLRTVHFSDFAIIVDRKTNFPIFQQALVSGKIPVLARTETPFSASEEIVFLIQFCTLLKDMYNQNISDNFRQSLIGISRSFVYQIPDDNIVNLFLDVPFQDFSETTYLTSIPEFIPIFTDLEAILPFLDQLPLTDIIQHIYQQTHLTSKIAFLDNPEMREQKLDYLYQKVGMLPQMDFFGFCDYFETISSLDDLDVDYTETLEKNQIAVQLTTMHKSKGLEYAICYYPGLTKFFNYRENKQHFIFSKKYGFFAKSFHNGFKKTLLHLLYENDSYREYVSERIRLLYVAFTRAREKQVILLPKDLLIHQPTPFEDPSLLPLRDRCKIRSFSQLLSKLAFPLSWRKEANLESDLALEQPVSEQKEVPAIQYETFLYPVCEQLTESYSKSDESLWTESEKAAIEYGKDLHETLQYFNFRHPELALDQLPPERRKMIQNLMKQTPFDDLEHKTIHQEMPFIYERGQKRHQGVIDLLIIGEDEAWIIDFKLKNVTDTAYVRQLDGYLTYVEEMTGKPVTTYLYSLLEHSLYPMGGNEK